MADTRNYDVIFIGGGLAAGLAALLLKARLPELRFIILDSRAQEEIPQTWSFQSLPSSIDPTYTKAFSNFDDSWLKSFVSHSWSRYQVRFPSFEKNLAIPYHSIKSHEFWDKLSVELGSSFRRGDAVVSAQDGVVKTQGGQIYKARQIIDTRGWADQAFEVAGYQKFVGLNIKTKTPHGVEHPILMDATVAQLDGFRFLYTLPWSDRELLIEDTHYSNSAHIDREAYTDCILSYAAAQGWDVESIGAVEQGALALPSFSKSGLQSRAMSPSIPLMGVRAGLFHPTTGYSIYEAVLGAETLLESCQNSFETIGSDLKQLSQARWKAQEFYRRLNNMLFFAAEPKDRYQVLERFYEHDENLISRFYAGVTSTGDKLRIMSGRPPIAMKPAIYHFFNRSEVQHG